MSIINIKKGKLKRIPCDKLNKRQNSYMQQPPPFISLMRSPKA